MLQSTRLLKLWGYLLVISGLIANLFFWLKIVFRNFNQYTLIVTVCMMAAGLINIVYAGMIAKNTKIPETRKGFLSIAICLMQLFVIVFAYIKLKEVNAI